MSNYELLNILGWPIKMKLNARETQLRYFRYFNWVHRLRCKDLIGIPFGVKHLYFITISFFTSKNKSNLKSGRNRSSEEDWAILVSVSLRAPEQHRSSDQKRVGPRLKNSLVCPEAVLVIFFLAPKLEGFVEELSLVKSTGRRHQIFLTLNILEARFPSDQWILKLYG